jgi:hypothetical protein
MVKKSHARSRPAAAPLEGEAPPVLDPQAYAQSPPVAKGTTASSVPRYVINMDTPPLERWAAFVDIYRDSIRAADALLDAQLREAAPRVGPIVRALAETATSAAATLNKVMFGDDIKAIAQLVGLPVGRAVALQLVYEASALCTSVVVPKDPLAPEGATPPAHIRTMDWEMDFLRPLTVELVYVRSGQPVFITTTWAGYAGVLTGMRLCPSAPAAAFGVSVNFRSPGDGTFWTNLSKTLNGAWPIGFLVREAMEHANGFDEAAEWLRCSELIAPCYFTISGTQPGQGYVVTRARVHGDPLDPDDVANEPSKKTKGAVDKDQRASAANGVPDRLWSLGADGACVQCNADWWSNRRSDDIMESFGRRKLVKAGLEKRRADAAKFRPADTDDRRDAADDYDDGAAVPRSQLQSSQYAETSEWSESLWEVMSRDPVCNEITIYGTLMVPGEGIYETRIPAPQAPPPHVAGQARGGTLGLRAANPTAPLPARLQRLGASAFKTCKGCGQAFDPALNAPGRCAHTGPWHVKYADCSTISCGMGLGPSGIGKQHWGCCFNTDRHELHCPKSGTHVAV